MGPQVLICTLLSLSWAVAGYCMGRAHVCTMANQGQSLLSWCQLVREADHPHEADGPFGSGH